MGCVKEAKASSLWRHCTFVVFYLLALPLLQISLFRYKFDYEIGSRAF